jgi:hypothetical protein
LLLPIALIAASNAKNPPALTGAALSKHIKYPL